MDEAAGEAINPTRAFFMDSQVTPPDKVQAPVLPIRVFILSGHKLIRQGLRDLLEHNGFDIAGESGSAAEAIRLVPALEPDLALLDDRVPDGTGIEVCRALRSATPDVKCLILTGYDDEHAVRAAVLGGASGYILKQIGGTNELVDDIRTAAAGQSLMKPGVRERVAESLYATATAPWLEAMTLKERKVFAFMARGLTNRQIGQEMFLSEKTVEQCVSSVLEKLGFRRRGQLTTVAPPNGQQ